MTDNDSPLKQLEYLINFPSAEKFTFVIGTHQYTTSYAFALAFSSVITQLCSNNPSIHSYELNIDDSQNQFGSLLSCKNVHPSYMLEVGTILGNQALIEYAQKNYSLKVSNVIEEIQKNTKLGNISKYATDFAAEHFSEIPNILTLTPIELSVLKSTKLSISNEEKTAIIIKKYCEGGPDRSALLPLIDINTLSGKDFFSLSSSSRCIRC